MDRGESTVLWRLFRPTGPAKGAHLRAVILPGGPPFTLALLVDEQMDRVENYESIDLAMFRADDIKRSLLADEWHED